MRFSEEDLALLRAHAEEAGDLERARGLMRELVDRRNSEPLDDLAGLSADQMDSLLYRPFESPNLIEIPEVLATEPAAPILDLLIPLLELLEGKPLRLTAKGNLPTAFVKELAATYSPNHDPYFELHREYVRNEDSFSHLHVAKVVADLAGLVHKRHGKLHLTKRASRLLNEEGPRGVHPLLLRAYVSKYNWGYTDRYDELPIVQWSWAFSCYLLRKFGKEPHEEEFYADLFLRAFPDAVDEVGPSPYTTPDRTVKRCYSWRALVRFLGFFGLAEFEWKQRYRDLPTGTLVATPLLRDAVRLRVG